jgi:hypothetical protein
MGIVARVPEGTETIVFVEAPLLPPGYDGAVIAGVEYVARVEVVDDLPPWADAARVRDVALLPQMPTK